jgi:hypothetical protein
VRLDEREKKSSKRSLAAQRLTDYNGRIEAEVEGGKSLIKVSFFSDLIGNSIPLSDRCLLRWDMREIR